MGRDRHDAPDDEGQRPTREEADGLPGEGEEAMRKADIANGEGGPG